RSRPCARGRGRGRMEGVLAALPRGLTLAAHGNRMGPGANGAPYREGTMFDRLSRSWALVKASASVLRQDKELLVFPLLSLISLFAVLVVFAVPVVGLGFVESFQRHGALTAAHYIVAFLFYFSQYFVIFFFNSAL